LLRRGWSFPGRTIWCSTAAILLRRFNAILGISKGSTIRIYKAEPPIVSENSK
jgi:hypothetical protein